MAPQISPSRGTTLLLLIGGWWSVIIGVNAWSNHHRSIPLLSHPTRATTTTSTTKLGVSTPFELDYYDSGGGDDDDEEDGSNPYNSPRPLACPPDTKLVLGLNKYSHDTSLCAANAETGQVLFAISKERLTRNKHDSGNVATLVESCLHTLDLGYESIQSVVMNNHHHRILPLEEQYNLAHLQWESGLGINGGSEGGYDDEENLLSDIPRLELSHHLAHAYSTACQAPFDQGMVVVMDGMGETYRTMKRAQVMNDPTYVSDFSFGDNNKDGVGVGFDVIPSDLDEKSRTSYFDWREAESVYVFEKKGTDMHLKPVFKRFTEENSPPSLYNHGFENMDSVGALYSRASSHIFGDWNACGKVMGLAPWRSSSWTDESGDTLQPPTESRRILWGTLYSEEEDKKFQQDKDVIAGMPLIARMDSDLFDQEGELIRNKRYDFDDDLGSGDTEDDEKRLPTKVALDAIALANRIQVDLEEICMDFVKHFKEKTGQENLCIAGGVGLNSVLNGRLSRELDFANTYISPYPGDDGIAVGCCAYGLFGNELLDKDKPKPEDVTRPPVWKSPLSPYTGPNPTEATMKAAIAEAEPWLDVESIRDEDTLLEFVATELQSGNVVAWYQGRSEMGPRALGHRSILADPRKKSLVRFINEKVKKRESFRPFAPSALIEHAAEWFDLGDTSVDANKSPYMSLTAMVKEDKRDQIPAVTHVDGSSRLQTVTPESEPLYHKLISRFYELTGVPMVLNTSFNTIPSEPIVETPQNAIRSFLCSMGSIDTLVMGDYIIKRKKPDLRSLLGEADKGGQYVIKEPGYPKRTGPATFQTSFEADEGAMDEESVVTVTKVRMPSRPMHHSKAEWVEVMDELEGEMLSICDGTNTLNDIMTQYTAMDAEEEMTKERMEETELIVQNLVHRLVRLYEQTLISW
jgi:predicted NodU family carbamoyl transferase